MRASVARIVEQFKQSWTREIDDEAIESAMRESGHDWRNRKLGPIATVQMFLLQILHGNTACNHMPHLARKQVTGSAYCDARGRLPLEALQTLLTRSTAAMAECARDAGLWLGHRLFFVDGSSFSMPDTRELQAHFGQSGQQATGCGFPTAHWLALVHFGSGLIQKVHTAALRTHDLSGASQLHPELQAGDVLIGDRAFGSYAHFALLLSRGVQAVMRAHQRTIVDFTPGRIQRQAVRGGYSKKKGLPTSRWIKSLGELDQIVEWFKPDVRPEWLTTEQFAALPASLFIRELQYHVTRPGFRVKHITLTTTLLDAERYSADTLAEAYQLRWAIETNFGHLKTTMGMDVLRCQTVRGVIKELTMFLLVYNLVRMTMLEAARRQEVSVERISFIDALRWLATATPGDPLPELVVNPLRPQRIEPRAIKRRPKQYDLLNKPRAVLKQTLTEQAVTN
jgi:hypothetical protein